MQTDLNIGVEMVVIAIREQLMLFFKGSCVEQLAAVDNLYISNVTNNPDSNLYYQRREIENRRERTIRLGNIHILTMHHNPDTIIFNATTMKRSAEFILLYQQLDKFLAEFLGGVTRKVKNG